MRWTAPRIFTATVVALAVAIVTSLVFHPGSAGDATAVTAQKNAASVAKSDSAARATAPTSTPAAVGDVAVNSVTPAALAALRAAAPGATVITKDLVVGSLTREYVVIEPSAKHGALPMIMVLHGSAESVVAEAERDELVPLVQQGQAILVYPSSATPDLTWNAASAAHPCCQLAGSENVPDAQFITALVPVVKAAYSPSHVDLVGFSNGGKLAYTLTCTQARLFDAVAVVSAVPLDQCSSTALPIFIAIGSLDTREPLDTHVSPLSATVQLENAVQYWRQRDGCTNSSLTTTIGVATQTTWTDCSGSVGVTQVLYANTQHIWPRSNDVGVAASAATLIWNFLSGA